MNRFVENRRHTDQEIRFRYPRNDRVKDLIPTPRRNIGKDIVGVPAMAGAFVLGTALGSVYEIGTMFNGEHTEFNRHKISPRAQFYPELSANQDETLKALNTGMNFMVGLFGTEVLLFLADVVQYPITKQVFLSNFLEHPELVCGLPFLPLIAGPVLASLRRGLLRGVEAAETVHNIINGKSKDSSDF